MVVYICEKHLTQLQLTKLSRCYDNRFSESAPLLSMTEPVLHDDDNNNKHNRVPCAARESEISMRAISRETLKNERKRGPQHKCGGKNNRTDQTGRTDRLTQMGQNIIKILSKPHPSLSTHRQITPSLSTTISRNHVDALLSVTELQCVCAASRLRHE